MENFVVSARKYRPATFNTVVGQLSITGTLKNAIKNNQLAQAFLFCGPRGVGKTTCARILAKTINCFNRTPEGEACDKCESCVSFNNGQSLNIYELDAASNNSVDDIRSLTEQVRFAPQLGKYKVYIIDEVHMLTTSAFNAFLKTLEEPPAHAIFILATTEKHKILPTILSRCQKFDFNRITVEDISKHLAEIAQKENITANPEGLHVIAAKADGGLRDALSMFDQIVSYSGGHSITYQSVLDSLYILDHDYYFKAGDFMLKGDISGILLLFNEILANGFDGLQFISGLAEHLRNLLVCKDSQTVKLLEVSESTRTKYIQQSSLIPQNIILQGIGICTKAEIAYKAAKNQRLLSEYTLLQIVSLMHQPHEGEKKNNQPVLIGAYANVAPPASTVTTVATQLKTNEPIKHQDKLVESVKIQQAPGLPIIELEKGIPAKPLKRSIGVGISINQRVNITKPENKETDVNTVSNLPVSLVTQEQLQKVWLAFSEKIQHQKKYNLYSALTLNLPVINVNDIITHQVANKTQQNEIDEIRDELLPFLRTSLNNYNLNLQITINESIIIAKAYTPQEKFNKLVEINPLLLNLKQKLDLDF